ncbi:hypothetical protein GE061_008413 [Apolygus lucorum]|uniref:Ubiquitin-like domain-containing protein n=1 Tax=Apolygus lucorum TaxID=248454 RepID=A0A8S9WR84_APOLU|nr:hypothetical protein GE061_008413 [Apolygus lucorum]
MRAEWGAAGGANGGGGGNSSAAGAVIGGDPADLARGRFVDEDGLTVIRRGGTLRMNQQQLEQAIGIEGDPPFDEYVQQILDTFQEETEAYETIPMDHVTTPEPCDAPQTTLAGIVNCIRYAAKGDIRMTRISNGYIAVVAMLRVARWVPQYQRIAQERDHLLEQREDLRTERAKLLRERAAAWKEIQVLKAALGVEIAEPPAARTVTSSPPHRTSTPIDQSPDQTHAIPEPQAPEPRADELREMATDTRRSPVASTSRARSITPNSSARKSPTQPISLFREPAMALRNATRKGGRMPLPPSSSSASEEERPGVPNHGGGPEVVVGVCPESPRTVPKLILKRFKSSAAKQHKTHKKIRCPICKKHCSQLVAFRCYACQETTLEVSDQTSVKDLKQHVFQTLKVPVNQQKLLLTGKPLSDEKYLIDYPLIKDGTKINLVVKKTDEDSVLRVAVTNFLRKSYNEQDSQKIADEFMKEFYRSMSTLNLEDIERIASTYYSEDELAS